MLKLFQPHPLKSNQTMLKYKKYVYFMIMFSSSTNHYIFDEETAASIEMLC